MEGNKTTINDNGVIKERLLKAVERHSVVSILAVYTIKRSGVVVKYPSMRRVRLPGSPVSTISSHCSCS